MQEGQIVAYGDDIYRVRRDHGETLELVNSSGYYEAPTEQVTPVRHAQMGRRSPLTIGWLQKGRNS